MTTPYYRECLNSELSQRLNRNPGYSLRAFAKALDVPVSSLSRAMSGERSLSVTTAARIAANLRLSPRERALFIGSLGRKKVQLKSGATSKPVGLADMDEDIYDLEEKKFRIIADWYHFAILEMTYLKNFDPDPNKIASELGISPVVARMAIGRLKDAGLLEQKQNKYVKTQRTIWAKNGDGFANEATLEHQKQCLTKAIDALMTIPFSERASSTMTMPIDRKKIPLAKRMIEEFAVDLCRTLSSKDVSDVFQLSINFHSILNKGVKQ